ncbi:MAG: hypothetical protein AB8B72_06060 [Crocinitomicaceae bacterium]
MKIIIYSLLILCILSCKKEEVSELDKLPEYSATGSYNFGCLINGEAFIAKVYNGGWTGAKMLDIRIYNDSVKKLKIIAKQEHKEDESLDQKIFISVIDFQGLGKYKLEDSLSYPSYVYPTYYEPNHNSFSSTSHHVDQSKEHSITITHFDETNKIISGWFSFSVYGANGNFTISEGRFDGRYED